MLILCLKIPRVVNQIWCCQIYLVLPRSPWFPDVLSCPYSEYSQNSLLSTTLIAFTIMPGLLASHYSWVITDLIINNYPPNQELDPLFKYKWPSPMWCNLYGLVTCFSMLQAKCSGDTFILFAMLGLEVFMYCGSNTICVLVYTPFPNACGQK